MYLALIPQLVDPSAGHTTAQGFTLGAIQIAVSLTVNGILVVCAGAIATFLVARPRWTSWQRRLTGTLLGTVTVVLALEVPERAVV